MPVIDKYVHGNLGLRLPTASACERERKMLLVYDRLCEQYAFLMRQKITATIRRTFDRRFPWAIIADLKKIDLVLWQSRAAVDSGRTGDRPVT